MEEGVCTHVVCLTRDPSTERALFERELVWGEDFQVCAGEDSFLRWIQFPHHIPTLYKPYGSSTRPQSLIESLVGNPINPQAPRGAVLQQISRNRVPILVGVTSKDFRDPFLSAWIEFLSTQHDGLDWIPLDEDSTPPIEKVNRLDISWDAYLQSYCEDKGVDPEAFGIIGQEIFHHQAELEPWSEAHAQELEAHYLVGEILNANGQLESALSCHRSGLARAVERENPMSQAAYLMGMGGIDFRRDQWNESAESFLCAARIFKAQGDLLKTLQTMANVGACHLKLGNIEQALDVYRSNLSLAQSVNSGEEIARSYDGLASALVLDNRVDEAMEHLQIAIRVYEDLGDLDGVARCYDKMGWIELERNRSEEALEMFQKSLGNYEAMGQAILAAQVSENIARILMAGRRGEEASPFLDKALILYEESGLADQCAEIHRLKEQIGNLSS